MIGGPQPEAAGLGLRSIYMFITVGPMKPEEAPDGYRFLDWSGQGLEVSDAAAVNFVVGVVLCR